LWNQSDKANRDSATAIKKPGKKSHLNSRQGPEGAAAESHSKTAEKGWSPNTNENTHPRGTVHTGQKADNLENKNG